MAGFGSLRGLVIDWAPKRGLVSCHGQFRRDWRKGGSCLLEEENVRLGLVDLVVFPSQALVLQSANNHDTRPTDGYHKPV